MKAKRPSKSPEEINAALAAKKGPVSKFFAMNFETGPFFAASAALISSGLFDGRLAFIVWASGGIQPLHVIGHALFEGKLRLVAEFLTRICQVGLGEVLVMRVRVLDVFR